MSRRVALMYGASFLFSFVGCSSICTRKRSCSLRRGTAFILAHWLTDWACCWLEDKQKLKQCTAKKDWLIDWLIGGGASEDTLLLLPLLSLHNHAEDRFFLRLKDQFSIYFITRLWTWLCKCKTWKRSSLGAHWRALGANHALQAAQYRLHCTLC